MELLFLNTVDSTNKYAKENILDLSDKTLIYAEYQSNGRGRLQRKWNTNSGSNIYASIVLKPSKDFRDVYLYKFDKVIYMRVYYMDFL